MQFENTIFSISLDLSKIDNIDNFAIAGKGHSCCPEHCWSLRVREDDLLLEFGNEEIISSTVIAKLQTKSSVVSLVSRGTFDLEVWIDGTLNRVLLRRLLPDGGPTYIGCCPCIPGTMECSKDFFDCSIGEVDSKFALPENLYSLEEIPAEGFSTEAPFAEEQAVESAEEIQNAEQI